jgi:cysteine desulfurase
MIYLDHNATTPLAPEVRAAMLPFMEYRYGNPSSNYALGREAKQAVERARRQVADLINADPGEIIFTSGGTEGDNHAVKGVADHFAGVKDHMITTQIEHPAVLESMLYLINTRGWKVTFLPVDGGGRVDPDDVAAAVTPRTALISVMHANNETGVVQPVEEIGAIARRAGVLFHTDAAQSAGKIRVDAAAIQADLITLAGHKLYAPKGVGALYVRNGVSISPFMHGGGQESGRRAGTENVIYIVALGEACRVAHENLDRFAQTMRSCRDRLYDALKEGLPELTVFGDPEHRLPNTLFAAFPGVSGADVLAEAPELCASTGAACHDASIRLSHVLAAMKVDPLQGKGAVRLSTGRWSRPEDMDLAAEMLIAGYRRLVS